MIFSENYLKSITICKKGHIEEIQIVNETDDKNMQT